MDITELIYATFDKPDWVHELLGILLEKKMQFIDSMKGARFDLIETCGGSSSSTLISPDLHKEYCLPYDRKMHDALHDLGFSITYHTCGGTFGIEEYIVENGCDASRGTQLKSFSVTGEKFHIIHPVYAEAIGFSPAGVDRPDVRQLDSEKSGEIRGFYRLKGSVGMNIGDRPVAAQRKLSDAPLPFDPQFIRLSG